MHLELQGTRPPVERVEPEAQAHAGCRADRGGVLPEVPVQVLDSLGTRLGDHALPVEGQGDDPVVERGVLEVAVDGSRDLRALPGSMYGDGWYWHERYPLLTIAARFALRVRPNVTLVTTRNSPERSSSARGCHQLADRALLPTKCRPACRPVAPSDHPPCSPRLPRTLACWPAVRSPGT